MSSARHFVLTALAPAPGGRLFVGRAKQLRCEVEQARICVEVLGGVAEPLREETAFLGDLEACEPACRFDLRLGVNEPSLSREELHSIAYFLRREAGLVHIAKPAGERLTVNPPHSAP